MHLEMAQVLLRRICIPFSRYIGVSSEAWAMLRDWASVAGWGRLLLSGSVAHASLKTAVSMINLIES